MAGELIHSNHELAASGLEVGELGEVMLRNEGLSAIR
jgi:hypothetical protein